MQQAVKVLQQAYHLYKGLETGSWNILKKLCEVREGKRSGGEKNGGRTH